MSYMYPDTFIRDNVFAPFLLRSVVIITLPLQTPYIYAAVTGQFANKSTRGQSSRGLVNSRTSRVAEMFDVKFGVYN